MKIIIYWTVILALYLKGYHASSEENDVQDLIIGGRNASDPKQFPFMVTIQSQVKLPGNRYGAKRHRCGGTILSPKFILTAAHCLYLVPPTTKLWVKPATIYTNSIEPIHRVQNKIEHPEFFYPIHDLVILQLETEIEFSAHANPILLPAENVTLRNRGIVMGWGKAGNATSFVSNIIGLQYGFVNIWNIEDCKEYWKIFGKDIYREITDRHICAINREEAISSCKGDSGGPIVVPNQEGRFIIIGVTSFGAYPCGSHNYLPTVYSRVSVPEYLDWIRETIQVA